MGGNVEQADTWYEGATLNLMWLGIIMLWWLSGTSQNHMHHNPSHSGSYSPTSSTAIENIWNVWNPRRQRYFPPHCLVPRMLLSSRKHYFLFLKEHTQIGLKLGQQNQGTVGKWRNAVPKQKIQNNYSMWRWNKFLSNLRGPLHHLESSLYCHFLCLFMFI